MMDDEVKSILSDIYHVLNERLETSGRIDEHVRRLEELGLEVPDPVWKMSTGNCASCWPSITSCAACAMRRSSNTGCDAATASSLPSLLCRYNASSSRPASQPVSVRI